MIKYFRGAACVGIMVFTDALVFIMAVFLGYSLRAAALPLFFHFSEKPIPLADHLESAIPVGLVTIVLVFSVHRLYTRRFCFWEKTRRLLKADTLSFILLAAFVFFSKSYAQYSRVGLLMAWFTSLFLFPLGHSAVRRALTKRGLCQENVLILGRTGTAVQTALEIQSHRALGYRIAGFLTPENGASGEMPEDVRRLSGGFDDLEKICRNENIHTIIIIPLDFQRKEFIRLVKRCELLAETIKIVPMTDGLYSMGAEIESLEDLTFISIKNRLLKPWNIVVKKGLSLILTLLGFIVLFPFLLLIAAAIRLDSRGPVIFSQDRLGKGEKPFKFFKFRSMHVDADARLEALLERDPSARAEWKMFQKIRSNDPRVTRVGRFIRKWSLDELPQLINVFRGDMNLIGPRPYLPRERERIGDRGRLIFRVEPGITGLWQVRGRNLLTFNDRLHLDEYYIRNWSLWLDTVVLLKTIKTLLRREGAF